MAGVVRALVMKQVQERGWVRGDLDRPIYFPDKDALVRCFQEIKGTEWGRSASLSSGQQSAPQYESAADFLARTPAPIMDLSFLCGQFNLHLRNSGRPATTPEAANEEYSARLSQLCEVVSQHTTSMPYWRMLLSRPYPAVRNMDAAAAGIHDRQKSLAWITVFLSGVAGIVGGALTVILEKMIR